MASEAMDVIIGVDVCKDRLDLFEYHSERSYWINNDAAAIKAWLDGFAGRLKLALEPTNRYHLGLAECPASTILTGRIASDPNVTVLPH